MKRIATCLTALGGARHQVRRFLWLFGRVWTEALLLPLKAVCRTAARWVPRLARVGRWDAARRGGDTKRGHASRNLCSTESEKTPNDRSSAVRAECGRPEGRLGQLEARPFTVGSPLV